MSMVMAVNYTIRPNVKGFYYIPVTAPQKNKAF